MKRAMIHRKNGDRISSASKLSAEPSEDASDRPALYNEKIVILAVLCAISLAVILILLPQAETREFFQNSVIEVTSASAVVASILVYRRLCNNKSLVRTHLDGLKPRYALILMMGMISWFAAESIWNYYVYALGVEIPFPSVADILYLAGYPLVAYYLYRISSSVKAENEERKFIGTALAITVIAFIVNLFLLKIAESSIGFSQVSENEVMTLILSLTYPILDAILIVPAIVILFTSIRLNKGLKSTSALLLASGMICMVIADTGFGYTAVEELSALEDGAIWDILYSFSYILISGSLLLPSANIAKSDITVREH